MTRGLTWHEELEAADLEREAAAREAAALQEVERSRSGWQVDFVGFVCFCWVFVLLDLQEDHDIYNWKIEVGDTTWIYHGSCKDSDVNPSEEKNYPGQRCSFTQV